MNQARDLRSTHGMAWILGVLALVPFAAGVYAAYADLWLSAPQALAWLLAYTATIVSFIGGVQWGLQLAERESAPADMALAVCPALLAWLALMLAERWTFVLMLVALIWAWLADENGLRHGWQRLRFVYLRRLLTAVVVLGLIAVGWRVMRG